ncbi:MAG: serine/threonine protein kinase [Firmicutes bacterium]|nr:serine/threonine protein kinase [Bacillota bacterium]
MLPGTTCRICPLCKSSNRVTAKFCIKCGYPIRSDNPTSNGDEELPCAETGTYPVKLTDEVLVKERFLLTEKIYEDGKGIVYNAFDTKRDREVVVKIDNIYLHEPDITMRDMHRFLNDGEVLSYIRHKYIPRVVKTYYEEKKYIVVMKKAEGKSLAELIRGDISQAKGIPVANAVKIVLALCELVEYLHQNSPPIVHRNIKPTKVIINSSRKVILLPWVPRLGKFGSLLGARGYASPEQYREEFDNRSDIYGLAATLYGMIAGKDPAKEAPFHFVPLAIIRPDVSNDLDKVISKALNLQPDLRYSGVAEFKNNLFNAAKKYLG